MPMNDLPQKVAAIDREVFASTIDGREVIGLRARRAYDTAPTGVWEALTDPERLGR